jgi:hypothetical protein
MVGVLASSVVDREFEPTVGSNQRLLVFVASPLSTQHDDEVRFVLDQHTEFDFYSVSSLKEQSADRHVAPLRHIILIPSQPVFALSP